MADETYQVHDHHGVFRPGAELLAWVRKATDAERFDAWKRTVLPRLTDDELAGWVRRSDLTVDQRAAAHSEILRRMALLPGPPPPPGIIRLPRTVACPTCEGWGQILDGEAGECPDCAGTGVTPAPPGHRPIDFQARERGVVAPVVAAAVVAAPLVLAAGWEAWDAYRAWRTGRRALRLLRDLGVVDR